ncbi:hypothetical protein G7068_09815 [Leucobacter viscericola]|uniref:Protein kinase domain-containing protein n=1 Tax=Leucobacter viscericola TaxID=2714935 RepID=A0A6G7XFY7_9MICO|nr:hypothetical protein [Leucobacter viscericola]QIK63463.1 hypothetical protein G7068_09815 [Leucobacter viscericola]
MEYICFFHPRLKGFSPEELCKECGRRFDFPSQNPPKTIHGLIVESELGRGFYAVSYRVRNPRTGVATVMKVTPKGVYEPPDPNCEARGGYGERRDFENESKTHVALQEISEIAHIIEWGGDTEEFGGVPLEVFWTQMELVRGETIDHYYSKGDILSPRTIAQVAEDLLTLSEKLELKGIYHNDLHGGNAAIVELAPENQRRRAIDPSIAVKVFDIGSAAKTDGADFAPKRFSDLEQISSQIHRLLDRFDDSVSSSEIVPSDVRLSAQLRKVAQTYAQVDWKSRRSTASDMLHEVRRAYTLSVNPEQYRPIEFQSVQDHYNAQTLPPAYAKTLIHDPDGLWTKAMTSAGPQLVVGMRGCGKTMLLRSLEWSAHAVLNRGENQNDARVRLEEQSYLGLFVSCAYLLRAPREQVGRGALQRLYLAYAREAVRAALTCEVHNLGEIQPEAMDRLCELIKATVPTFELKGDAASFHQVELELSKAIQRDVPDHVRRAFVPLEAFTELAKGIRSLVDIWESKTVLFLLDDVSKRFVSEEDLTDLLTQFCLKSETFGFKISTETQTQVLHSPSGERALEGRDYQVFDLGERVLQALSGRKGSRFLAEILDRRQRLVGGELSISAKAKLGDQSLRALAEAIRTSGPEDSPGRKSYYHGLSALAAVCVGDIGDVLQIFHKMTTDVSPTEKVSPKHQHRVFVDEGRLRLLSLVKLEVDDAWYFNHSVAFASASYQELVQRERIRQYADIFIEIDSSDKSAFQRLMALVDKGVYIIIGFRQRSKTIEGDPIYQFALRFRKLFGLYHGMPLSNRDRFELNGEDVPKWLKEPTSEILTSLGGSSDSGAYGWLPQILDDEEELLDVQPGQSIFELEAAPAPTLFDDKSFAEDKGDEAKSGAPRTANNVAIDELPIGPDTLNWASATLVAAVGFEDRASESLEMLAKQGVTSVGSLVLARYAEAGNAVDIETACSKLSSRIQHFDVDTARDPSKMVEELVESFPEGPVIVDVSGLTKPLIYCFTNTVLRSRHRLFIVHSAAKMYFPAPEELSPMLKLLDSGKFPEGLRGLDAITPGEGTSFQSVTIGEPWIDASLRSLLIAFVTLKYRRLDAILGGISADKIIGVRTTHSTAPKGAESRAIGMISDYLVSGQNGVLRSAGAMDAKVTYDLLMEYYDEYVLDDAYRIDVALTGTKMQTVGVGAFSAVGKIASVLYSAPANRDTTRFTKGIGRTRLFELTVKRSR